MTVLSSYQAMHTAASDMLAAAKNCDWGNVTLHGATLHQLCATETQKNLPLETLPASARQELRRLIEETLAFQAETQEYTQPWLDSVRNLLRVLG